jgi:hypothetical protein
MPRLPLSIIALLALAAPGVTATAQGVVAPPTTSAPHWYRGNTHAHTLQSDGDSPPLEVARWYRDRGYQFLFVTDHEKLTDVAPLNAALGAPGRFLVIAGQEVTQILPDSTHPDGRRQAHVNSLRPSRVVMPQGGASVGESYRRNLAAIAGAGGLAQVNHPNWRWSVRPDDMFSPLPDSTLFELWNGHPGIGNLGGATGDGPGAARALSTEALWDTLLTRGRVLWGVGSDDSHTFARPWDPAVARPGQAWVVVRAESLSANAIVAALHRGDFYASTGVSLADYRADRQAITITIAPALAGRDDTRFTTEFVGRGGRVLATVHGREARYRITGGEGYVRARIADSMGRRAWTQPVVLAR